MTYRLLFDENLSPELVKLAVAAGYVNSTCIRDRGLSGAKDWELMDFIIGGDYTLVTLNSIDFRGKGASAPGGLYANQAIHAGLVCFGADLPIDIDVQRELTSAALEMLTRHEDLINRILEINLRADGEIAFELYWHPTASSLDHANSPPFINDHDSSSRGGSGEKYPTTSMAMPTPTNETMRSIEPTLARSMKNNLMMTTVKSAAPTSHAGR